MLDIVLVSNAFKAMKRALKKTIDAQPYATEDATKIFNKPIVRAYAYYIALMHFYQDNHSSLLRESFSTGLNKIASPKIVGEFEKFFPKIITKTRKWYLSESQGLKIEVSSKKLDDFLDTLSVEIGVDLKGDTPFTRDAIKWSDMTEDQ